MYSIILPTLKVAPIALTLAAILSVYVEPHPLAPYIAKVKEAGPMAPAALAATHVGLVTSASPVPLIDTVSAHLRALSGPYAGSVLLCASTTLAVALAFTIGRVCLADSAFGFSCITHPLLGPVLKALKATSWWGAFLAFAVGLPPAPVAYMFAVAQSELVAAVVPGSVVAEVLLELAARPDVPAVLPSFLSSIAAGTLLVALYLQITGGGSSSIAGPSTPSKAERPTSPRVRKSLRRKTEPVEPERPTSPAKKAPSKAKTPAKTSAKSALSPRGKTTAKTPAKTPTAAKSALSPRGKTPSTQKVAAYVDDYEETPRRSSRVRTSRA